MKTSAKISAWIKNEALFFLTLEPLNVSNLAKKLKINRGTVDWITAFIPLIYEEDNGLLKVMEVKRMTKAEIEDYCEILQDRIKELQKKNIELEGKLKKYEDLSNK